MPQQANDPRITEILDLAAAEGLSLVLRPETVCALEDIGVMADPFSGRLWFNPAATIHVADLQRVLGARNGLGQMR
jgi:hypothetical protein